MIETKLFEVRDAGTFIPVIATRIAPYDFGMDSPERYLMRRAGYSDALILVGRLSGGDTYYDPFGWTGNRTMFVAHEHIAESWHELESGAVVDVEYILGKTREKKQSERVECFI